MEKHVTIGPHQRRHALHPLAIFRRAQSVIGLIGIFIIAIVLSPRASDGSNIFLEAGNLTDVLRQMSITGIMALAMTLVILTAGIDLSVGSIMALATCVLAEVLVKRRGNLSPGLLITFSIAAAIVAAAIVGALNGLLIALLEVPPFIVTLATMIGIRGVAKRLSNNSTIDIGFGQGDIAAHFADVAGGKPAIIGTFLILAAIFWLLLARTIFGRYVRAVGDNAKAALYAGLPIFSVTTAVYTLSGFLAGIAGVLYAAKTNQSDPNAGVGYELDVIAAVVIGGTSLAGGRGSLPGTVVGVLIMGILTNLLGLLNIDANVQMMIKAVIILLAVWAQKSKRN